MILIIGIPNAGKTTYSKRYTNVVHFDSVMGTNQQMRERVIEMVKNAPDLVVEGVYDKASDRKKLVEAANVSSKCIWLDTPVETCLIREREYRKRPEGLVVLAHNSFEPPTFDEGWDEIIIIRGDNEQRINRKAKN